MPHPHTGAATVAGDVSVRHAQHHTAPAFHCKLWSTIHAEYQSVDMQARPSSNVHISNAMPDIESLMQQWPAEVEQQLHSIKLPDATLVSCEHNTRLGALSLHKHGACIAPQASATAIDIDMCRALLLDLVRSWFKGCVFIGVLLIVTHMSPSSMVRPAAAAAELHNSYLPRVCVVPSALNPVKTLAGSHEPVMQLG